MIVIKELKKMVLDLCLLICNIDLIINKILQDSESYFIKIYLFNINFFFYILNCNKLLNLFFFNSLIN